MASPHSKKATKQRQQSVAIDAPNYQNGNMGKQNGHKPRPVSLGGNLLPTTPMKEQAYAGPTFQASPAPSSLPVPKFFSRSVPNVPAQQQSLEAKMAGEQTPEKQPSPEPDVVTVPPRASQQSPLEMFFRADKAEREKSRSGSMLSPEMATRQVPPATEPRIPFQETGKSGLLQELDGQSGDLPSPNTTPHYDRQQSAGRPPSAGIQVPTTTSESERQRYTQDLKDLLFNNVNGAPAQAATPPPAQPRASSNPRNESPFTTPSPFQRSTSGPSTPAPSSEQQNHSYLLYGNRNLSPMFKAVRNETPPRPSALRQQELANDSASAALQNQPRQYPQIDPNSFSRQYLDQQIRASPPATLPQLPLPNSNKASHTAPGPPSNPSQHGVLASYGTGTTPSTGGSTRPDIKSMEDDLRRKLNILSN